MVDLMAGIFRVVSTLIFGTVLVCAELSITVSNITCGGIVNLHVVQTLHLNYYGAEIGDPFKSEVTYSKDKTCLYKVSLSSSEEYEICVYRKLKNHQNPSDLACTKSLKVFTGKFYNVHMPSQYSCSDLSSLCTSERNVYLLFQYVSSLRDVSIELDVYFQSKAAATKTATRPKQTTSTVTPSWIEDEVDSSSDLTSSWKIVIVVISVLLGCCCGCLYYQCCCKDNAQTSSQNVNNQPEQNNAESIRMLQTPPSPVNYPTSENTSHAAGEPPDYDSVCPDGFIPDEVKNRNMHTSGFEEDEVIPSAPPPPYPGI